MREPTSIRLAKREKDEIARAAEQQRVAPSTFIREAAVAVAAVLARLDGVRPRQRRDQPGGSCS